MQSRSMIYTILAVLLLLLSTSLTSLAALPATPDPAVPPNSTPGRPDGRPANAVARDTLPPNATEWCALVYGTGGTVQHYSCLLFLLPPGLDKPDPKHLTVLGINNGCVVTDLLDTPQTIDATDPRVIIRGKGQTRDGQSRDTDVQPQVVTDYCGVYGGNVDIVLYDGFKSTGDQLCLTATAPPEGQPYLGDFGWNDRMSSWRVNDFNRATEFFLDAWYAGYWGTTCTSTVPCQADAGGTTNNKLSSVYIYVP